MTTLENITISIAEEDAFSIASFIRLVEVLMHKVQRRGWKESYIGNIQKELLSAKRARLLMTKQIRDIYKRQAKEPANIQTIEEIDRKTTKSIAKIFKKST